MGATADAPASIEASWPLSRSIVNPFGTADAGRMVRVETAEAATPTTSRERSSERAMGEPFGRRRWHMLPHQNAACGHGSTFRGPEVHDLVVGSAEPTGIDEHGRGLGPGWTSSCRGAAASAVVGIPSPAALVTLVILTRAP